MIKDINIINFEIKQNQVNEMNYKGKLNQELKLVGVTDDGRVIMDAYWKNRNVIQLNEFINKAIERNVSKVLISNNYDDWSVEAYIK